MIPLTARCVSPHAAVWAASFGVLPVTTESQESICYSATIWLELKGDGAVAEANRMLDETRRRGDGRAIIDWLKIIAALEDMRDRRCAVSAP